MGKYQITIEKKALKNIARFPKRDQLRVFTAIEMLADDPRPIGVKKLQGEDNAYRIRLGNYLILYRIKDKMLAIAIADAGQRQNIYNR